MRSLSASLFVALAVLVFHSGKVIADTAENTYQVNGNEKNVDKSGDIGLGLMLGSTTGITAKIWTSEVNAFDLGIAFQDTNTAFMADYLWHWRNAFTPSGDNRMARSFVPYLGVGLIGGFGGYTDFFYHNTQTFGLGARVPAGIEFIPRGLPLGFFAELDPGIGFVPDVFSFFEANIGGRYYF